MRAELSDPVVIITWVHYLGPPGLSTSQILGTFSRFSEDRLGIRVSHVSYLFILVHTDIALAPAQDGHCSTNN